VVALALDEDGIPATADGRIKIAERIYTKAAEYGIERKDILIDGLAMTISSDNGSALVTLETLRRIRDEFGGNTIIIRAVPTILSESNIEDVILSALQNKKTKGYTDEEIYTMACKAAVKANKRLSAFEIDELLKKLAKLENSGTCPHGRPICVTITEHELEKKSIAEAKAKQLAEEKAQKELEQRKLNPTQEDLLKEIRDLLKQEKDNKK